MIINMNGAKAPETPSPTLQEKTVTPETLPTVIGTDEGYDGLSQVTVNPDSQLKAENIRSGKTIFGVAGSFVGGESSSKLLTALHHCLSADGEGVDEINTSDLPNDLGWSDVNTSAIMPMMQLGCCVKTLRVNDSNPSKIRVYGSYYQEGVYARYTPTKIICESTTSSYNTTSEINGCLAGLPEIPSGGRDKFLASKISAVIVVDGDLTIDDTHWFNNYSYNGYSYSSLKVINADGSMSSPPVTTVIHFKRDVTELMTYTFYFQSPFSVRFYADTPPKVYSDTFSVNLEKLIVPKGKLETYQNADGWSLYADKIVEADE